MWPRTWTPRGGQPESLKEQLEKPQLLLQMNSTDPGGLAVYPGHRWAQGNFSLWKLGSFNLTHFLINPLRLFKAVDPEWRSSLFLWTIFLPSYLCYCAFATECFKQGGRSPGLCFTPSFTVTVWNWRHSSGFSVFVQNHQGGINVFKANMGFLPR